MSSSIYCDLVSWFAQSTNESSGELLAKIIRDCDSSVTPVWHPLGFIHCKLAQGPLGDTFRLHVWSTEHRDEREQLDKVHDHLFRVTSRVVYGGIKNVTYRFKRDFNGTCRELRVDYKGQGSALRETRAYGDLEVISSKVHMAPTEYSIPAFELHDTSLAQPGLALTVVHTTEPSEYEPRAIFHRGSELPPTRQPIPCDHAVWLGLVRKMIPI